jgi:hypothetical protein
MDLMRCHTLCCPCTSSPALQVAPVPDSCLLNRHCWTGGHPCGHSYCLHPTATSSSSLPSPGTNIQQRSHPLQAISQQQAAQMALLRPFSPLHQAEWELGLLGLPEEQQGCFHAGCLQSLPPHSAAALAEACAYSGGRGSGQPATGSGPTTPKPLHLCSGCKLVRYCGGHCQAAAWRAVHRHTCKLYAAKQQHDEVVCMAWAVQAGMKDVADGDE